MSSNPYKQFHILSKRKRKRDDTNLISCISHRSAGRQRVHHLDTDMAVHVLWGAWISTPVCLYGKISAQACRPDKLWISILCLSLTLSLQASPSQFNFIYDAVCNSCQLITCNKLTFGKLTDFMRAPSQYLKFSHHYHAAVFVVSLFNCLFKI